MSTPQDSAALELLELNRKLLASIAAGDWAGYAALCDPSLTAFEAEARGHLVEGLDFHRFYFDRGGAPAPKNTTMVAPHARVAGEMGVVSYVRLTQTVDAAGNFATHRSEETRVWQKLAGGWKHVHFHRSANA